MTIEEKYIIAIERLQQISLIGGNLPDRTIESIGGVNDGKSRALMVINARTIAMKTLQKLEESVPVFVKNLL